MSERPFEGRVALVTGGGRGIGRAIAIGLAGLGASVVVVARTEPEVTAVADGIVSTGGSARGVVADVADDAAMGRVLAATRASAGPIDILVNNAAVVWPIGASRTIDASAWSAAVAINVTAVARLSFACVGDMLDRGWGRIVNISSGIAANPAGMIAANAYATTKAALEAHTLNLAAELDGTGVTVNVYRPGGVDTAMQEWIRTQPAETVGQDLHDRFVAAKEGGSLLTPEQSAGALLSRIDGVANGQIWSVRDAG